MMTKHWELRYSGDYDMPAMWMVQMSPSGAMLETPVAFVHIDTLPADVVPSQRTTVVRIKIEAAKDE